MVRPCISIRGASEHFLKNIDLDIPLYQLVVVTGVSGSGKSSLVVDTLYREGQRRYLEFLLGDHKRVMGEFPRPQVNSIEGLPPVFFVGGRSIMAAPRSTVGTLTEVGDILRILYAQVGDVFCHKCGQALKQYTTHQIVEDVMRGFQDETLTILAPMMRRMSLEGLRKEGFVRVRLDHQLIELDELASLPKGDFEIVVDRIKIQSQDQDRLADSIEVALRYGGGVVILSSLKSRKDSLFATHYRCLKCSVHYGEISPALFSFNSPQGACPVCHGLGQLQGKLKTCPECKGFRLKPEALSVRVGGYNIAEIGQMDIHKLVSFLTSLKFSDLKRQQVSFEVIQKIIVRLHSMMDFGVFYLSLNRRAQTLSAGEFQRVRLASQMASGLVGVLYVLDEPTTGLHSKEIAQIIHLLKKLRDMGNTILVIEHDEAVIRSADTILELGPGAGPRGGEVVTQGSFHDVLSCHESLTRQLCNGDLSLKLRDDLGGRMKPTSYISLRGVRVHNLKNIDVKIPLNVFCCVTGVSGSGKSSLVFDVLYEQYAKKLKTRMIYMDPYTIVRSARSNVATLAGIFDRVRQLFSSVSESRLRGYNASRFSFNAKGGRCEVCKGAGVQEIQMFYLPDLEILCEVCSGSRYNYETLEVKYKGLNIAKVLEMTVEEAYPFFQAIPFISTRLSSLVDLGLGYLRLGQSGASLSAGEALRIKLATELTCQGPKALYILDEPTRGLHLKDIEKLLKILFRLRNEGNSILVIEHHLEVIRLSDYVIDLGPGAGEEGGQVVIVGTPEEIAQCPRSETGRFLKG